MNSGQLHDAYMSSINTRVWERGWFSNSHCQNLWVPPTDNIDVNTRSCGGVIFVTMSQRTRVLVSLFRVLTQTSNSPGSISSANEFQKILHSITRSHRTVLRRCR